MCSSSIFKPLIITLSLVTLLQQCEAQEHTLFKRVRECLSRPGAMICLKEEALDMLNDTIMSEKPMRIFDLVEIERDPNYRPNLTENELPEDPNERSAKLNGLLYKKVEEYFESRNVKFSLANAIEARKKKNKTGGMLMMGGLAMMGMMGQMFMGKIAFLAGAALLVAKMALMLAAISALKKSGGGGGGGGETSHVVYTTSADSGYGHSHGGGGGGGWHRSLNTPEAQNIVYSAQIPADNNYSF